MSVNRRFIEVILGLLLIIIGLSVGVNMPAVLLVMGGLALLVHQSTAARSTRRSNGTAKRRIAPEAYPDVIEGHGSTAREKSSARKSESKAAKKSPTPRLDEPREHALIAMENAGLDPAAMRVVPIDIGVMAFVGSNEPEILQYQPVPDNVDYLQPFVQLKLPQRANGRVKFEILDSDGQPRFVREDTYELQRGLNLLTPAARLPIHDALTLDGEWTLRVSADGVLLARHRFTWIENDDALMRKHIQEDGEISHELRAMLAENRLSSVSLDDLLAEQDDDQAAAFIDANNKKTSSKL